MGEPRQDWEERFRAYTEAGVPELLARVVAGTNNIYTLLPVIQAAEVTAQDPLEVAATCSPRVICWTAWYQQQLNQLPVANAWQALAREAFRDEVDVQQRTITIAMLNLSEAPSDPEARSRCGWSAIAQPWSAGGVCWWICAMPAVRTMRCTASQS